MGKGVSPALMYSNNSIFFSENSVQRYIYIYIDLGAAVEEALGVLLLYIL